MASDWFFNVLLDWGWQIGSWVGQGIKTIKRIYMAVNLSLPPLCSSLLCVLEVHSPQRFDWQVLVPWQLYCHRFTRPSKFWVTIKTRGVEKIVAPYYFLLPLFLLIPLETFYRQLYIYIYIYSHNDHNWLQWSLHSPGRPGEHWGPVKLALATCLLSRRLENNFVTANCLLMSLLKISSYDMSWVLASRG